MPNYEPTPKRFSVISVPLPRLASRRNSIDDAFQPKHVYDSSEVNESSPVDLVAALQHLHHIESEREEERGRSRFVGGDQAEGAALAAPFARRENSASTRERIAVWEERSHNRSHGRSESGGKNSDTRRRISVVPEIPEQTSAWDAPQAQMELEGQRANHMQPAETTPSLLHRDHRLGAQETATNGTLEVAGVTGDTPRLLGSDGEMTPARDDHTTQHAFQIAPLESLPPTGGIRARTPVQSSPRPPLTPEATPKAMPRAKHHEMITDGASVKQGDNGENWSFTMVPDIRHANRTPSPTPTTVEPTTVDPSSSHGRDLPPTPQATPKRVVKEIQNDHHTDETGSSGPGVLPVCIQGGQIRGDESPHKAMAHPQGHYHLPSGLFTEELTTHLRRGGPQLSIFKPQASASALDAQLGENFQAHEGKERPQYHNVWRIESYEPRFPLQHRPPDIHKGRTANPEDVKFSGNPLREPPRSQLSAEPSRYHDTSSVPYPYTTLGEYGDRSYAVNIPPSPSATYMPGGQDVRPSRNQSRSRSRTRRERYVSRKNAGRHEWDAPPVIERAFHAASISMIQGLSVPVGVYRGLRDMYYPTPSRPDIIKAYSVRRRLPVR